MAENNNMKNHNFSPSLYPYLVAEMIEADPHESTLKAIAFMTREDLKQLKNKYLQKKRKQLYSNKQKKVKNGFSQGFLHSRIKKGCSRYHFCNEIKTFFEKSRKISSLFSNTVSEKIMQMSFVKYSIVMVMISALSLSNM